MPQNKMQKIKAQQKMGEKKVNVVSVEHDQGSPMVRFSTSSPSPCPTYTLVTGFGLTDQASTANVLIMMYGILF